MANKDIYYAALAPYRAVFRTGLPLLCYHKVARKPAGARLRSTFISPRLFDRQMRELRAAGFRSVGPEACLRPAAPPSAMEVVLTFDDGSLTALRAAVPSMAACGFTAINYLVADLPGGINEWDASRGEVPDRLMNDAEVREWMAAGNTIGAHTRTHPDLTKIPPDRAREEISGSKKILEDRFGVEVNHFCYPYGRFSPAVRDLVAEAGYETAVTTEPAVFRPGTDPLLIPRFGARAHSVNFRNVFRFLTGRLSAASAPQ